MAETIISAAGMRIIKLLVGNPPRTVSELINAAKVTRTAVTEQLNELVAGGYVERKTERLPGRGRPRHLYTTTETALLLLFAGNQQLVMPAFWKAIEDVGGDEFKHKVLRKFCKILAEHYSRRIAVKKPEERLRQFLELLRSEGHIVDTKSNGQLMVFKRSCPFISIADRKRSVCTVDQELMSIIVGRPVRRIDCRHEGAPCCTFEILPPKN
jgi:DeoR family transcriptional regulator, suf operon transcriptional repressor